MKIKKTKQAISVMQAAVDGKPIQYRDKTGGGEWIDTTVPSQLAWDWWEFDYRIKPEPKLRPWRSEEVKPCLIRYITARNWQQLLGVNKNGCLLLLGIAAKPIIEEVSFETLSECWLHSTDNGATWKPCGVEESQ